MSKSALAELVDTQAAKLKRPAPAANKRRVDIGLTNQRMTNALAVGAGSAAAATIDGFLSRKNYTKFPVSAVVGAGLTVIALLPDSPVSESYQEEAMMFGAACAAYPLARSWENKVCAWVQKKPAVAGVGYAPPMLRCR